MNTTTTNQVRVSIDHRVKNITKGSTKKSKKNGPVIIIKTSKV